MDENVSNRGVVSRLCGDARVAECVRVRGAAPIVAAVQFQQAAVLRRLLADPRVEVNSVVTTSGGHGLLHWAAMCGNTPAIATIAAWPGADVNLRNSAGETPLMLAVKTKNAAAVSALLGVAGVDLEVEEGDWSLEDLARRWMASTGRRDSRFRAQTSRQILGLLSQARSASQQLECKHLLNLYPRAERERRRERERAELEARARLERDRARLGAGQGEELQEVIRRELARLQLEAGTTAAVVDLDTPSTADTGEYVVVVAAGEAGDRLEQLSRDPDTETSAGTTRSVVTSLTTARGELPGLSGSMEELNKSVNEISSLVEEQIEKILKRMEEISIKIAERERSLRPLSGKQEQELAELQRRHEVEEGGHYADFRQEVAELSELHERELEQLQQAGTTTRDLNRRLHHALHRLEDEEAALQKSQETRIIAMFVKQEAEMKELRRAQEAAVEAALAEDGVVARLRASKREAGRLLARLTSKPEVVSCPECPVCYEALRPPRRILQCVSGHLTCVDCARKVERFDCPTCKQDFSGRATAMEQFLRTLFNKE